MIKKFYAINKTYEEFINSEEFVNSAESIAAHAFNPDIPSDVKTAERWMETCGSQFVYVFCKEKPYLVEIADKHKRYEDIIDYLALNAILFHEE